MSPWLKEPRRFLLAATPVAVSLLLGGLIVAAPSDVAREILGSQPARLWGVLTLWVMAGAAASWGIVRWSAERQRHDHTLEDVNKRLKLSSIIVQNVSEAIFLMSPDHRIVDCNPAAERLFQATRPELLSGLVKPTPLLQETDPDRFTREHQARLQKADRGESVNVIEKYRLRTGRIVTLEIAIVSIKDDTGAVMARLGTVRDISDRQQTLDQLLLHAQALESVDSGIILISPAREGHRLLYANRAFTKLTGYQAEEVVGLNPRFLECEDTDPNALAILRRGFMAERPATTEVINRHKDGSKFFNRMQLSPVVLRPGEPARYFVCIMQDVTAERATEGALRRQALALETISDMVMVVDPDMRVLSCNAAVERMFGPRQALIGRLVTEVEADDVDLESRRADLEATFAARRPWIGKTWVRSRSGERRLVETTAAKIEDAGGSYVGHVAVSRDCTEAWELESKLRLHTLIMEQMKDGVVVFDCDNHIVDCNQAFADMVRVQRKELLGQDGWNFSADRDSVAADHPTRLAEMESTGQSVRERALRRIDGTTLYIENTKYPLRDPNGNKVGYVMVARDLSGRREAERRYRRSQNLYAGLVESALDAIISVDEKQRVVVFNRAAEVMFRCAAEKAIGLNLNMFLPDGLHTAATGELVLHTDPAGNAIGHRADGTEFPIEASISQVGTDSGRICTAIIRDLTESQAIESQLRQSEKMQAVGQLSGGIAHDFNNMLSVIGNSIDIALDRLDSRKHAEPALHRANRAVESAANLVEKLLTFSRKNAIAMTTGQIEDIVWDIMPVLFRTLPENIKIAADVSENMPKVSFEAAQVENALLNLAINARDAMPTGGNLTLRVTTGIPRTKLRDNIEPMVIVEVTDTGFGMSPAVRERALEPFFTTKAAGQGTGLGLAMVYGMIEQAHGHIEIDSTEGKGTTIRLMFPVAKEDGPKMIRRRGAQDYVRGSGEAVLVVEDNDDLRHAMVEQLRSIGYVPIEALDCAHALKILASEMRIDVLLSDVIMASDMNGKELAMRACELRPDLSVILCTGYAQAVLDEGVEPDWQVLGKPVTRRQLAESLHLAVTGEDETQDVRYAPAAS